MERNRNEHILVVDDEKEIADVLEVYLVNDGYTVHKFYNGRDALVQEKAVDISLPAELYSIERKMNAAKHTIERQKQDMRIAEQRKNDLVMYLAHDLKTPLASMVSYLSLLRDQRQIPEELREKYLSISLDKAQYLEDLINDFFEIAKFSLSDVTLQYSRINLTRLLEQLIYEFQPALDEKDPYENHRRDYEPHLWRNPV